MFSADLFFLKKSAPREPVLTVGRQRTYQPIAVGSTVIGIKYDTGVIIAADNLVSYGTNARYQDMERVSVINKGIIMGAGGDWADVQQMQNIIQKRLTEDKWYNDGCDLSSRQLYSWMTRTLYNRRCTFHPMWIDLVIGGMEGGKPFLGYVDMRGLAMEDTVVATGMARYMVMPMMNNGVPKNRVLLCDAAAKLVRNAMEVLYYRNCRSIAQYHVAICTKDGACVRGPFNGRLAKISKVIQSYCFSLVMFSI